MKKLLLLLSLVLTISCTEENAILQSPSQTQEEFIFEGTWIYKPFKSAAWIIDQGTGESSNQGSMHYIIITADNQFDWSIDDAVGEYDWFIEIVNGQKILTVLGGNYGEGELIIQNEGDFCNEEWYSLAVNDVWYERVDDSCN